MGCQTVLSSRKERTSHGLWASAAPWTTRLTFAAAARSSSATSPSAPATSEVGGPPGSSTAASGLASEATATTAFPPTSGGKSRVTSPSSAGSSGQRTATTPVGSGTVKLKYGPATGFEEPSTWASLSVQPAYQTTRSIACSTSASPEQRSASSAARASTISARR